MTRASWGLAGLLAQRKLSVVNTIILISVLLQSLKSLFKRWTALLYWSLYWMSRMFLEIRQNALKNKDRVFLFILEAQVSLLEGSHYMNDYCWLLCPHSNSLLDKTIFKWKLKIYAVPFCRMYRFVPLAAPFCFSSFPSIGLNSLDGPRLWTVSVKPPYGTSGQHLDKMLHRSV